jgi:hypothetical protein
MTTLGPENWSRLGHWLVVGLNVYFVYGFPRGLPEARDRAVFTRRACTLFAGTMALLAIFLWKGDGWLESAWDTWVGFPPGLAHGIAIFLALLVAWNLVGAARAGVEPRR